jgi:osmotically-inducible protein OsmY
MPTLNPGFEERIDAAIKNAPHLKRHDLRCVVNQGRVVLKGVVRTYFQKQMAQEAVKHVDGVRYIDNELEVNSSQIPQCDSAPSI